MVGIKPYALKSLLDEVEKRKLHFDSGTFEYRDGYLFFNSKAPEEPCSQPDCPSRSLRGDEGARRYHRHGWYKRFLETLKQRELVRVLIHILRWLCPHCGHTISVVPPGVLPRRRACVLVHFLVLWHYLNSPQGIELCDFGSLEPAAERSRVFRSLNETRANILATQQSIREVLLINIQPEAWEVLTQSGLSPPEMNRKCRNSLNQQVWETLSLLVKGADFLGYPLNTLLARAHERSLQNKRSFFTIFHCR